MPIPPLGDLMPDIPQTIRLRARAALLVACSRPMLPIVALPTTTTDVAAPTVALSSSAAAVGAWLMTVQTFGMSMPLADTAVPLRSSAEIVALLRPVKPARPVRSP